MNGQPIRLMIVDDHAMVRKGMKVFLDEYSGICVTGEAGGGAEALQLVAQLDPDVVLIDMMMPGMDGIETIRRMIAIRPDQRIIVLSAYEKENTIFQAIQAGAMGYLGKDSDPDELIQAINKVYGGVPAFDNITLWHILAQKTDVEPNNKLNNLTEREIDVLKLLARGYLDDEIAGQLWLTNVTVRTHISRILSKLGLKNRVQAALYCLRSGLVTLEEVWSGRLAASQEE